MHAFGKPSALVTHMLWLIIKSGYMIDVWRLDVEDVEVSGFLLGHAAESLFLLCPDRRAAFTALANALSQTALLLAQATFATSLSGVYGTPGPSAPSFSTRPISPAKMKTRHW